MKLSNHQKRQLRSLANRLTPIIQIGKEGLTENVIYTIELGLKAHELIKIHVLQTSPLPAKELIDLIVNQTKSFEVSTVGSMMTIYRPSEKKKIELT